MSPSPVQLPVEIFFLVLHLAVLFVIVRGMFGKNATFTGSFYKLYAVQSLADCVHYVISVLIYYRFAPDPMLLSYYINVHYMLSMWSTNLQLLMHILVSANRYTAICRPFLHVHVWKGRNLCLLLFAAITGSFLSSCMLLFAPIQYNTEWYRTEGMIAVSILSPSMNSARFLIALIITIASTLLSFAMDLAAIVTFRCLDLHRKRQLADDYRLLVFACIHFAAQLFFAAFLVCGVLVPFIPHIVGPFMRCLQYIVDAQCFSGPVALIFTSKPLRSELFGLFRRSKVNNAQTVFSMRQTSS